MKNFLLLIVLTAVAAIAVSATAWLTLDALHAAAIASASLFVALCIVAVLAFRNSKKDAEKATLMFKALKNDDFSMRFLDHSNQKLNRALEDIAQIIKNEKIKARRQDRYYGLIINRINAGIFAIDIDGQVRLCNDNALQLFGINVFTHISQLDKIDINLKNAFLEMSAGDIRLLTFTTKNGQTDISASLSKIDIADKSIRIFVLNNIYSAVDKKEIEAWIKLTRILTHEIMNCIAPICSISEQLLESHDKTLLDEGLKTIQTTSAGLIKFTETYRKFTSIPKPICRLVYVKEMIDKATLLAPKNDVEIHTIVEPADLIVNADESLIVQVIVNLLKNAIEAGASTIVAHARYIQSKDCVTIDISDNAPEIAKEVAEQIFVPFFTTKTDGSGIGLSVSKRIMDLHNGSLQFIQPSKEPACIKTFRMTLP